MGVTGQVLVVVCRRPRPGVGKRRLAAALGEAFVDELKPLLLDCALEDALAWPGPVVIAPDHAEDASWAQALVPGAQVLAQQAGNLGERIQALDMALRAAGHERLFFIGSDAPALTPDVYAHACAALDEADACLATAADGGLTLLASRCAWPDLARLPWGGERLGEALHELLLLAGWAVDLQPGGYDVDRARDVASLLGDLARDPRPARRRLHQRLVTHFRRRPRSSPESRPEDRPARGPGGGRARATDSPAEQGQAAGSRAGPAHTGSTSVVIPVLGDRVELERLLGELARLEPRPGEVIVVDGAADPDCARLCARHGVRHLAAGGGRGPQLRAGAEAASGGTLWFLHADARPAIDALARIDEALADPGVSGGCFRFQLVDVAGWRPRLIEVLTNWRSHRGTPYGDQALFARRNAYRQAGGFAPTPLFEEVQLVRGLRRLGRFVPLATPVGVSPRRWLREGWLRRSLRNRLLVALFVLGVPAERLNDWYRRRRA